MSRFNGKTVIVTGASAGVGESCARLFVGEGARVVLVARRPEPLQALAQDLGGPNKAIAVSADVSDSAACMRMLDEAERVFGGVHVLVNNAGFTKRGPIENYSPEDLGRVVDVNLRAPIVLTRMALPHIRKSGGGAIVNVASIAGKIPVPHEATYSATKFGLRAFTLAMADELNGSGVTISAVSPGPIETGFLLDELDDAPDLVFSQPMSTAGEIAQLVVDCAADGRVERTRPVMSGYLATLGYLLPPIKRLISPALERKGAKVKERYRREMADAQKPGR